VNLPRHPLRINVGFLLNAQIGYYRDIHFEFPHIQLENDLELYGFAGVARVSRTPQGILLQCKFSGKITGECVRCLDNIIHALETEFDELFAFSHRSTTESDLILSDDGNIDLEPLAREYLVLEIPISTLCREDCKGLCPVCGENLNLSVCEHITQPET
jgi:uncharacterized protein